MTCLHKEGDECSLSCCRSYPASGVYDVLMWYCKTCPRFALMPVKVCNHYFGKPRQSGSSHCVYQTPWPGDPRVNIQNHKGKAKPYQVKQVLLAIEKIEVQHGS